ncbi:cyclic AMP receptor-like protein A [Watersipora subatra]|uniref:cyclic AMP receptor-like protein A n=1 Tax=Watersipora subatra TaxID=2589382 RepID=UPI00355B89E5
MDNSTTTNTLFQQTNETIQNTTSTSRKISNNIEPMFHHCRLSTEHMCKVALDTKNVFLSMSIIGVAAALICILLTMQYRTFHSRIILQLLLANLLVDIFVVAGDGEPEFEYSSACIAQGFFHLLFDWVEILWMIFLTVFLMMIIVRDKSIAQYERYLTAVAWIVPVFLACLPLTTQDYGPSGAPYCWLRNTSSGKGWRFGLYLGPVIISLILILAAVAYMLWHVRSVQSQYHMSPAARNLEHQARVERYLKPLIGYVISFLLIKLLILVTRIQDALDKPISVWLIILVIVHNIYGLTLSALFFVISSRKSLSLKQFRAGGAYYQQMLCTREIPGKPTIYEVEQQASTQ